VRRFRSGFGSFASPQNPFLAGRLAMQIQGVWLYNFIEKYAPHLDWDAAPYPSADPERLPRVTIAECDVLIIPRGSPHPREAFAFIRYVNSQAGMEKLCLGHRKFTALAEVSDGFLRDHPHPRIELFIELAHSPHARATPAFPLWTEYADEMSAAYDRAFQLAVSPEEALAAATERLQGKLDRNLRRWDRIREERLQQWAEHDAR
jgi:ABC-type glycerol-3-phosphate transport system substrate-binding protein